MAPITLSTNQNPSRIDKTIRIIVENVDGEGEIAFIMASVYTEHWHLGERSLEIGGCADLSQRMWQVAELRLN